MIGYLVAGAGILTGIGIALWSRLRMARTYRRMEEMLEAEPAKPRYLRTVYGIGYTWAADGTCGNFCNTQK